MKRKRFTEEQIIAVLKEAEAGVKTGDLARRHGISEATIYNWKAKYGGMEVSEAKRLRSLEDENANQSWMKVPWQVNNHPTQGHSLECANQPKSSTWHGI